MTKSIAQSAATTSQDPFSDLLWEENQQEERLRARRHGASTLTADIEAYLGATR